VGPFQEQRQPLSLRGRGGWGFVCKDHEEKRKNILLKKRGGGLRLAFKRRM